MTRNLPLSRSASTASSPSWALTFLSKQNLLTSRTHLPTEQAVTTLQAVANILTPSFWQSIWATISLIPQAISDLTKRAPLTLRQLALCWLPSLLPLITPLSPVSTVQCPTTPSRPSPEAAPMLQVLSLQTLSTPFSTRTGLT